MGSMGSSPMGQAPLPGQARESTAVVWCPSRCGGSVRAQVTPETDRRLSAIIEKVIRLMQEIWRGRCWGYLGNIFYMYIPSECGEPSYLLLPPENGGYFGEID